MERPSALADIQSLSILSLSAPYLHPPSPTHQHATRSRSSTSSADALSVVPTPTILAADLIHYRDLFSKLRFSYVEQVAMERFLRSITAEHPESVVPAQQAELELQLRTAKAALQERKAEVRDLVRDLEEQGKSLAARYAHVQTQTALLDSLPPQIQHLEASIAALRPQAGLTSSDASLSLPLQPTRDLLGRRETELDAVDAQIAALAAALPGKEARVRTLRGEVEAARERKDGAVEEAREARRRRGGADQEDRGRWLRGVEAGLRHLVQM